MTISTSTRTAGPFTGDGVTTVFPFAYKVFSRADVLVVVKNVATGVQSTKVLDADYTVTLNPDQNAAPGGIITIAATLAVGYTMVASSNIAYTQAVDLTNSGGFYPRVINDGFDRVVVMIQQLLTTVSRSLHFPLSETGATSELPAAASRANNLLGFDASGNVVTVAPSAQSATALQTLYATIVGSSLIGFIQAGVGA